MKTFHFIFVLSKFDATVRKKVEVVIGAVTSRVREEDSGGGGGKRCMFANR